MCKLEEKQRQFMWIEIIKAIVMNMFINCGISYFMARPRDSFMLWGEGGLFGDNIGNTFFMALIMSMIMTMVIRGQVKKGKAPATSWDRREHPLFRFLPAAAPIRGVVIGLYAVAVLIPLTTWLLSLLMKFPMSLTGYLVFKAVLGGLISVVITPVAVVGALSDKPALAAQQA